MVRKLQSAISSTGKRKSKKLKEKEKGENNWENLCGILD
jgi:hypothetical protein